jgi:DNA polymerase V
MIALVDCNNFYVSCERVFRPDLEEKPVIILSNNDGCAISISDEAKALGIRMAVPVHMVMDVIKKHNVHMFSSNYTLYGDMSDRVMKTIASFVPQMEVYSIDETFLDLSAVPTEQLEPFAKKIKSTVKQYTGIPVSIGIAQTKTLAKIANRFAKKTKKKIGVHMMYDQQVDEVLKVTKVEDVWGIGSEHAQRLNKINVHSAYDFIQLPEEWVRKNMSVVGLRMLKEMKGENCIEWEFIRPKRKAIRSSRSFGQLITDRKDIEEAVSNFAATCALKLRKEQSCANTLQVWIETNPFRYDDKQYSRRIKMKLEVATCNSGELIRYAMKGLDIIYTPGYNFMKAGVLVTDLVAADKIQQGIFLEGEKKKNAKAMRVMDVLNSTYGMNTVRMAAQGFERKWKLKAAMLSPSYTTNIHHVPKIKCHV